ncbi:uncharacterized protein NECHADRAFT_86215 [Fusarium vanettenii 77-13-4]|uniref:Uncharacterized protein n=1 Tax=Fusarium vanettenii (strain ATCC MYA-4622 / CBS 123669 / FGSC 9596 / NRRL 45880 / 77-13-4) TaxID=660122 RepID=C7ZKN5_FUSV7|nr:uncharacterized protein NECHADRAFT_86215 [Fusarium vanettenii 77-13-4]EEU35472.1 predicted protein [Fusarium vanettenii 77-13-4]
MSQSPGAAVPDTMNSTAPVAPAVPTAAMPMPGGALQTELLDALDGHASLMDKTAIRAVVAGTVAYDTLKGEATWLAIPTETEGKIPGVYVVGMSRQGQQGQFLDIDETEKLVDGLERYAKGARICIEHRRVTGSTSMTAEDEVLVEWVRTVDSLVGSVVAPDALPTPRFIQRDNEFLGMERVTEMFKRRCNRALDPSGKVRQIQSPLYVGCSKDLRTWTGAYERSARKDLADVNEPLCLVVSILEALNLPVDLSVQVAIRIWEADQLNLAEQLITTIAFSFVHQSGFNTTECGGTRSFTVDPTSAGLRQSAELLMAHSNTMEQNLRATLANIAQRRKFLDDVDRITDRLKTLNKAVREATPKEEFFGGRTYEEVKQIMAEKKQKLRDRIDQVRRENQQMELLNNILAIRAGRKVPLVNGLLEEEGEGGEEVPAYFGDYGHVTPRSGVARERHENRNIIALKMCIKDYVSSPHCYMRKIVSL